MMRKKRKLLFGTSNRHKLYEVRQLFDSFEILSPQDLALDCTIDEPYDSIEENAIHKAKSYKRLSGYDCFAEDTGLEVMCLGGAPGVHTARYAGPNADSEQNMLRLLEHMRECDERSAQFRTVVALVLDGKVYSFQGRLEGRIDFQKRGTGGFGYDPIFIPKGYSKTLAELPQEVKNAISHRAKAIQSLVQFLISD